MKTVIEFEDYEKITDEVYFLGNNITLRFNVSLGSKMQDGSKIPFHKEYRYNTNKYTNRKKSITVRRSFDYYLSFENVKAMDNGFKEFIKIQTHDMLYLKSTLKQAFKWFNSPEYKGLYAKDKKTNRYILLGKVEPVYINGLSMDKYISFEPTVYITYNDEYVPGVRMCLSSNDNYVDMSADRLSGLLYLIESFNLFLSAQNLITYMNPGFGFNLTDLNNEDDYYKKPSEAKEEIQCKTNRTITGKNRQKSIFDKIDGL